MEIIAKTKDGVLIKATEGEVKEILNSVTGKKPEELSIGDKIPAIDYASSIKKVRSLSTNYKYTNILSYAEEFHNTLKNLDKAIKDAAQIEL